MNTSDCSLNSPLSNGIDLGPRAITVLILQTDFHTKFLQTRSMFPAFLETHNIERPKKLTACAQTFLFKFAYNIERFPRVPPCETLFNVISMFNVIDLSPISNQLSNLPQLVKECLVARA